MHSFLRSRFTILLASLMGLFLVVPIFERHLLALTVARGAFTLILLSALFTAAASRSRLRDLIVASVLGAPAVVARWYVLLFPNLGIEVMGELFAAAFLGFTTYVILAHLLRAQRVTYDTIAGAICAYLLLGLTWAFTYSALVLLRPDAFLFSNHQLVLETGAFDPSHLVAMTYYSVITLTTTGFGDITPVRGFARALTELEAITGQMYVATLVARLVSMHIIHEERARRGETLR